MRIGFIGLGNVGGKLAGSLIRNGYDVTVRDLDSALEQTFIDQGASRGESPAAITKAVDLLITCLPSPAISAKVMEGPDGALESMGPGKIWAEMSTTDATEIQRLGDKATGNISIFAGTERSTFEKVLPVLTTLGRRVLHTGPLGSASTLKVMTNYLASVNLASLGEALMTMHRAGIDLATTFEAIRISSGNSFVHETESQVILNGSRDVGFTMDLVIKDLSLFQSIADRAQVPLEISPFLLEMFRDGHKRYGGGEWSTNIVRRLEDACKDKLWAPGFPAELVDDEPEEPGYEVIPKSA
jgi:3-hydroxyisobutyrate dehydrogenase